MRSQSDHPRSASDRNDSYELCKKAKCYALRSSGTWTPIVNIIAVIPAGSSTASFSVVAHILLWFNTSPPWLGVCREHQQEFKAILNDDKNLQKSLKHSKPSKQNANIKCAYANGSKWQNATALLFASSSLYLGSWISQIHRTKTFWHRNGQDLFAFQLLQAAGSFEGSTLHCGIRLCNCSMYP